MKTLFKEASKSNPSNYRPISPLPLIFKIIEKLIHEQTSTFYRTMKFYTNINQDFEIIHWTDSCLAFLHDKIFKGFDKGSMILMILIDLWKAFDTIDHNIYYWKNWALLVSQIILLVSSDHTFSMFRLYLENCYSDLSNICFFL